MNENPDDYVVIWEAPEIVPPEFRLYYDSAGRVLFYTGDATTAEGEYIVIDAMTFAQARSDVIVIDGHITTARSNMAVCKLMPTNRSIGQECVMENISIIPDSNYVGLTTKWEFVRYEL